MNETRNPILELGLFLSAVHAILWIGLALVGAVLVGLGVGVAAIANPVAMLPAGFVGGAVGAMIGVYIGFCLLMLLACWRTHQGSRGWMWALMAISLLGLLDFGLLSTPARLLTVIGLAQVLGRSDDRYQVI